MPFHKAPRPSRDLWYEVAARHANRLGVFQTEVMASGAKRDEKTCLARWSAWRELLDSGNGFSVLGIAEATGFDHSTVLHAMKTLPVLREKVAAKTKPVPPPPPPPPPMSPEERMGATWKASAKATRVHGGM